jgi:hypothetical protein
MTLTPADARELDRLREIKRWASPSDMTPEEASELDRLSRLEAELEARQDAADERARMWGAGPPRPAPARVTIEVEVNGGPAVPAPAIAAPETSRGIDLDLAGMQKKDDGTWGAGFYLVGDG